MHEDGTHTMVFVGNLPSRCDRLKRSVHLWCKLSFDAFVFRNAKPEEEPPAAPAAPPAAPQEDLVALVAEMRDELRQVHTELRALKEAAPVAPVTNNTIIINSFGHEDRSGLRPAAEYLRYKTEGLKMALTDLHFNSTFPQNNNMAMESEKRRTVAVFQNGVWKCLMMKTVNDALVRKAFDIVLDGYVPDVDDDVNEWTMDQWSEKIKRIINRFVVEKLVHQKRAGTGPVLPRVAAAKRAPKRPTTGA